jgi:hypothetical protein
VNGPFSTLGRDAILGNLAALSRTHPHAVRAFYDDEVVRLMDGDEDLRALAEGEALANCVTKFTELAKHQERMARNPRGKK